MTRYCRVCFEPVVFLPFIGWQHVTFQGLDHSVSVSR